MIYLYLIYYCRVHNSGSKNGSHWVPLSFNLNSLIFTIWQPSYFVKFYHSKPTLSIFLNIQEIFISKWIFYNFWISVFLVSWWINQQVWHRNPTCHLDICCKVGQYWCVLLSCVSDVLAGFKRFFCNVAFCVWRWQITRMSKTSTTHYHNCA